MPACANRQRKPLRTPTSAPAIRHQKQRIPTLNGYRRKNTEYGSHSTPQRTENHKKIVPKKIGCNKFLPSIVILKINGGNLIQVLPFVLGFNLCAVLRLPAANVGHLASLASLTVVQQPSKGNWYAFEQGHLIGKWHAKRTAALKKGF